jgi:hypothetical protein
MLANLYMPVSPVIKQLAAGRLRLLKSFKIHFQNKMQKEINFLNENF